MVIRDACRTIQTSSDDWVRDIAFAVRDLVRQHGIEPFRAMVRQWKAERDEAPIEQPPPGTVAFKPDLPLLRLGDDKGSPTPKTIHEKYAVLAAIHDAICLEAEPIEPWHGHCKPTGESFEALKSAMKAGEGYLPMISDVRRGRLQGHEYEDDYRREMLAVLEDVRRDLEDGRAIRRADKTVVANQAKLAAEKGKALTREDILNLPEAPPGQRDCDVPLTPEQETAIRRMTEPMRAMQAKLSAFESTVQRISEQRRAMLEVATKPLQMAREVEQSIQRIAGKALADAVSLSRFDRLAELAEAYQELRRPVAELREVIEQMHQARQSMLDLHGLDAPIQVSIPALEDPTFWDSFTPPGEQIKDAIKEALAEHAKEYGNAQKTTARRGKASGEKWRKAQKRMIDLRQQGKLPSTLRQAAKLLQSEGFTYSTVRDAAHKSTTLRAHFGLTGRAEHLQVETGSLLDELAQQADGQTRRFIEEEMTPQQRQEVEVALRHMEPQRVLETLTTLATDPNAGRTGDVPLIENADQDSHTDDWSE